MLRATWHVSCDPVNAIFYSSIDAGASKAKIGYSFVIIEKVVDAWVAISRLAKDFPAIKELDINPLIAFEDHVNVVDGRVTLQSNKA